LFDQGTQNFKDFTKNLTRFRTINFQNVACLYSIYQRIQIFKTANAYKYLTCTLAMHCHQVTLFVQHLMQENDWLREKVKRLEVLNYVLFLIFLLQIA
jgi:hypothetical protein